MKIKHMMLSLLLLMPLSVFAADNNVYKIFGKEYDDKSYTDIIEDVGNIIGSPIEKDQTSLYLDMVENNPSYTITLYSVYNNTTFYRGPVDYLKTFTFMKSTTSKNVTKNYEVELVYGRGKVYSATIKVPYSKPAYVGSCSSSNEAGEERSGHKEFLNNYLDSNEWISKSYFFDIFSNKTATKNNLKIEIDKDVCYPVIIYVKRTDLVGLDDELEKITAQGKEAEKQAKEEYEERKRAAKFQ